MFLDLESKAKGDVRKKVEHYDDDLNDEFVLTPLDRHGEDQFTVDLVKLDSKDLEIE